MKAVRRAFYAQAVGAVLLLGFVTWLMRTYPLLEAVTGVQRYVVGLAGWGVVLYPLLYAACNVLLLPGGVLAIGSGWFFGLWWGFVVNLTGNVAGAALAFLIARKLGRERLARRFFQHRKWVALDGAIARQGWKIIFLSQVHPLFPSSLMNYLYGVTNIRFRTCMLWVGLGQAPGLFLYAYLGTLGELGVRLWRGETQAQAYEYVLWGGGLVLGVLVTAALGRIALRVLADAQFNAEDRV